MKPIFVTLLKKVRDINNNNFSTDMADLYMNVELIIPPEQNTALILPNRTKFFISYVFQDLVERRLLLVENDDHQYRKFWKDDFLPNYLKKLKDEGWVEEKPKSLLPD